MPDALVIDGGILAGGLATRMQGEDKGLQPFQNKMMVEWVYEALKPFVRRVIINCNRNTSTYQGVSKHTCADTIENYPGPLAGLLSLIEASDADYLLVSPCDTPLLDTAFGQKMLALLNREYSLEANKPLLLAVTTGGKHQPLHACISTVYKDSLRAYLNKGEHRVMQWMQENHAQWLDMSAHAEQFRNFNRLEDLSPK